MNNVKMIKHDKIFQLVYIDSTISNLEFIMNSTYCHILNVFTNENHRCKGYALILIAYLKQYCSTKICKYITLDDCSDNFKKSNNLYLISGFEYVYPGESNMICYL